MDDPVVARSVITQELPALPCIEVVGYAVNAMGAKAKFQYLPPDVMTLDVEISGINGIDFLEQFLPSHPPPAILISSPSLWVFDVLAAEAAGFMHRPGVVESRESFLQALTHKIIMTSRTRLSRADLPYLAAPAAPLRFSDDRAPERTVIDLDTSTGGTETTLNVFRRLPTNISGMVIVQHTSIGFAKVYAERLNCLCQMEVCEVVNDDEIRPSLALVAPTDYQAKVVYMGPRYVLSCIPDEKASGYWPSVGVLFSSMAVSIHCRMVGITMTGMGRDGASGLLEMRKAGAHMISRDKDPCVVCGTPMAVHDIGTVTVQASCDNIASVPMDHLSNRW